MQKSKVYRVSPPDIDQMSNEELSRFLNDLRVTLNHFPIKNEEGRSYHFKFYSLNEEIFLETNLEDQLFLANISFEELIGDSLINQFIIGDVLANSDVILHDDYLKINGSYLRLINLYSFSKRLMPSALMEVGDYCLFFRKIDSLISRKQVNTQRKLHHANLYSTMRNIESEASFQEAEKLIESMMNGEEEIFEVEGWFLIKGNDLSELNSKTNELIKSLKQIEITPYIESVGLSELFPTILTGGIPLFKRAHKPPTSYLANLIPLYCESMHQSGIEFYTRRGNPTFLNIFDESALNYNVLITGQSGAGKTMVAQKILSWELWRGTSAIVLDLGNSFKKTAAYYEGEILSLSFNPLQFKSAHYLKELVISIIPKQELSAKMEGKIFLLISENIESARSFRELVQKISSEIPDIELYFAELWEFFDDEVRDLSRFTYVDTSIYPDKIKAPLIIFLLEAFNRLEGRKIFIFDEVWSFLRNNADYIEECFRTFRKHGGSAIPITQGLDDYTDENSLGRIIPKLCSTKIFFQQLVGNSELVDSFDKDKIGELSTKRKKYSEFYIKTEFHRKIVRYYPTPIEYELGTSNDLDRTSFDRFYEQNVDYFEFPEIMNRFVEFKYYFGGVSV